MQMKTATNWMRAAVVAGSVLQATNFAVAQYTAPGGAQQGVSLAQEGAPDRPQSSTVYITRDVNASPGAPGGWSKISVAPGAVPAVAEVDVTVVGMVSVMPQRAGKEAQPTWYLVKTDAPGPNTRGQMYYTSVDLSAFVGQKVQIVGKAKGNLITVVTSTTPVQ
jgi:hypothetical protein